MIEMSVRQFIDIYSQQARKSSEYWLFDIKYWTSNTNFEARLRNDLKDLQLEFDDDLYFFKGNEKSIYGQSPFQIIECNGSFQ